MGERGAELGAGGGDVPGHREHELPGGRDLVEPEDPPGASGAVADPGRAAGRVEPHAGAGVQRVERRLEVLGRPGPCPAVRPRSEVDVGEGGGQGVGVDGPDGHPEGAHRHGVGADPAPEVVHGGEARRRVAPRVGGGDLEPAGLLQPVGREEHPLGELPELLLRPPLETLLGEHRGGLLRGQAGRAEAADLGDGLGLPVLGLVVEHGMALGGGEPSHGLGVHGVILHGDGRRG